VQESLANVMRHAGSNARAHVGVRVVDGVLTVDVVDDGVGAVGSGVAPTPGGHGIVGMQERAAAVGGALEARATPGGGFEVHARLPLHAAVVPVGVST